jgi:hypothetical protein
MLDIEQYGDSRITEEELLIPNGICVPTIEKHRFKTIYYPLFRSKGVNRIRPERSNKINNGMGTINNACMRPIVDG